MNEAQILGISLGLGALAVALVIIFIKSNIILSHPNELVIIAGRKRKTGEGKSRGYRVIRGGRGFKMPLVESVARLPLNTISVDLHLSKVMCRGMIPVQLEGRAMVKLAGSDDSGMDNAIERFLGKSQDVVVKTAKQAIEGAIRGVVATVSPEEANMDRLTIASQSAANARQDLGRLGIILDYLQVHEISDEQGYLEAIGRQKNAEVQRDARIAEAKADTEARKVAAEQAKQGREAEIAADMVVVEAENALSVKRSELAAASNAAHERSEVLGKVARVESELDLERIRVEMQELRQRADVVIPAQAKKEAQQLIAEGTAARITEDGQATAKAVEAMRAQWQDGQSKDLFMIQMLPDLMEKVTSVVSENLRIDKLTILDRGTDDGLPHHVRNLSKTAISMIEELGTATGIDLTKIGKSNTGTDIVPKELS